MSIVQSFRLIQTALLVTLLMLAGCSTKPPAQQIVIVQAPQKSLLVDCKVTPVGLLGEDYRTAFYAVSEAYMATAKNTAMCNIRLKAAREQLEKKGINK